MFSLIYILSIPIACYTYYSNDKSIKFENSEDEHEDVL